MGTDAAWVWVTPEVARDAAALARFAHAAGVRQTFVGVPWHGPDTHVHAVVAALRSTRIEVTALGGVRDWARRPELAAEWARRAHRGSLFAGTHLDIEPWTLEGWPAGSDALLTGLARAIGDVRRVTGLPVEVDLTPVLGDSHPTQLAGIARSADATTLMSYRDTAADILQFSVAARSVLRTVGRPYRLAVDTLPSPDAHTTFAGQSAGELDQETLEVQRRLTGAVAGRFMGIAVHDLPGWAALPSTPAAP